MVICDEFSLLDLDAIGLPNTHMVKKADCLCLCGGIPSWVIETKKTSLDEIVEQLEDTYERIARGELSGILKNERFNVDVMKALVIMEKGLGAERDMFTRDDKKYLQTTNKVYVKVKHKIPILVLTKREINEMIRNAQRWDNIGGSD